MRLNRWKDPTTEWQSENYENIFEISKESYTKSCQRLEVSGPRISGSRSDMYQGKRNIKTLAFCFTSGSLWHLIQFIHLKNCIWFRGLVALVWDMEQQLALLGMCWKCKVSCPISNIHNQNLGMGSSTPDQWILEIWFKRTSNFSRRHCRCRNISSKTDSEPRVTMSKTRKKSFKIQNQSQWFSWIKKWENTKKIGEAYTTS